MRYLSRIPKKIPKGRVIAHNHVIHGPDWPAGINGFRFWSWPADEMCEHDHFVLCPCGWSGLEHHAWADFVEDYLRGPEGYKARVKELEVEWRRAAC